jgi:uncharacterized protein (TIGR02466 family)
MSNFIDLFCLSVYRRTLGIDPTLRESLARIILENEALTPSAADQETAWLGDTAGHEFLFHETAFEPLFECIGAAIRSYLTELGLDQEKLQLYFQRSWATVSREGQRIFEHSHVQSHLSFAYYLQKPDDGGGIYFSVANHPNELAPELFTTAKENLGILKTPGDRTMNRKYLETAEDEILIFPSKTLHSTAPNMTEQPRISISADVVLALKDSRGHETLMPAIEHWRVF